jgi:hypothetical protein
VRCSADGLSLVGVALIERRRSGYCLRSPAEIERLLRRAYDGKIGIGQIAPGLARAALALNESKMWLAQSEAARLALPDLPNPIAALRLAVLDLQIAAEPLRKELMRAGWDPDQHPRAGVPPNPGWFAPDGASARLWPAAATEEDERPEEALDPTAEIRQRAWQSAVSTLREIDPANPQIQSLHGPDWVPSQADLDTLNITIREAVIRRVEDEVMPNGVPIGTPGNGPDIQIVPGGINAAEKLFNYLRIGGTIYYSGPNMTVVQLPSNTGFITFRSTSRSGPPAVEVNIPRTLFMKIHF